MYRDLAEERDENMFYEKLRKSRKRNLTLDTDEEEEAPVAKKQKKSKKEETEEFIIEKILDFKFYEGKPFFFIKWKGWPNSENTWEPLEHLDNCPSLLQTFLVNKELKYCDQLTKLKEEIAFGDLLSDDNLSKRLQEVDDLDVCKLKEKLLIKLLSMGVLTEENEHYAAELVQEARDVLQLYVLARKRCRQLMALKNWEEHINQVDKSKQKLSVVNDVDLAGPPEDFTYINASIPGVGVTIPDDPPIGCECSACNCRSKSCCGMQGGLFAYTVNKRLRVACGTPIYECNKTCKCSSECSNRVVQNGRNVKLCIFRTDNGCGWGVKTEQKIRQGQFVCQYVGEIITFEEAEKRGREYDAKGLTYLFDLDFNSVENPYTVDAAHLGSVSHFINHSCDPNLGVWAVWADCLDPNLPMIALFATRDIEIGEEICFDYLQKSSDVDDNDINNTSIETGSTSTNADSDSISIPNGSEAGIPDSPASPIKSRFEMQQENMANLRNRTECKCGSINCRKYLF